MALDHSHSAGTGDHVGDHNLIDTALGLKADLVNGTVPANQLPSATSTPSASTTVEGTVRLAGDLAGTAQSPTVPGLANKVTSAQAAAAAPVQSVAGRTGAVTLAAADVSGVALASDLATTNTNVATNTTALAAKVDVTSAVLRLAQFESAALTGFGHSYVATGAAGSLYALLQRRYQNPSSQNRAVAGVTAGQMADQARTGGYAVNAGGGGTAGGYVLACCLINDVNAGATSATVAEAFRSFFAQVLYNRVGITTSAFTFGTGWTSGVTTTTGSFFDFSFNGDTAYLCMAFTTAAATITVSRSGTNGATLSTPSTGGFSYAFPGVVKLAGFGAGWHTVRVTLTSGAGATVYYGLQAQASPATVLWLQEGALLSYSAGQNTTLTSTLPAAVTAILPDFPTVVPVTAGAGWDPTTMLISDGIHPNERGMAYLVTRLEGAIYALPFRQGQNVMAGGSLAAAFQAGLPNYQTSTVAASPSYTRLKVWGSDVSWVYALSPDTDLPNLGTGVGLVITGGTGFNADTYKVIQVAANFGTGTDGTRTMWQLSRASNNATATVGTAGSTGGTGFYTL